MSGTSLDGVDAAIITTDGTTIHSVGERLTFPYSPHIKDEVRKVIAGCGNVDTTTHDLTVIHAQAVRLLLEKARLKAEDIDVIGFHGQTVSHRPEDGITVQLGDGKLLAKLTGINVVHDFRSHDVSQGGQGAPLVPLYHAALVSGTIHPVAVVNIGGVANVTWIGEDGHIIAFDTGPGNALIDDWVLGRIGASYDARGQLAASGIVKEAVLRQLLSHPFFAKKPPKSLDRNTFASDKITSLSTEDGAATLTEFTAQSIARAVQYFPCPPKQWLVTGGGRYNATLMNRLMVHLNAPVHAIELLGHDGDALEAQAFAYLAVRSLHKLPLTLPSTTGVRNAVSGGVFCPA